MNWRRFEVFIEFLIFGVIMGIIEDLIAITLSTGEPLTWKILGIITLVSVPFAAVGELIVDRMELIPRKKKR
mgnify:FL=1